MEHLPPGVRVAGVEVTGLGGVLRATDDDEEPVGPAASDAHPEAPVGLVVDQLVVGLVGAQPVPPDLVGAPGLVDGRVVEALARAVPRGTAEDAGDLVGEQVSGLEVLDPDRVALVADHVGRVGQQVPHWGDRRAAEREELVALGEGVDVEQQLFTGQRGLVGRAVIGGPRRRPVFGVGHRNPAAGAVLLPLERAAVVPVAAVAGRHGQVGLAGPRLDLVEDRLAQVGQVLGLRLRVLVLRLEVGHHLGRALGTQPFVVVDAGPAVVLGGDGAAFGDRRLRREFRGLLHTSEPIVGSLGAGRGGVGVRPQAVDSTCGETTESVELPRTPVEQSVGPEECRTFFSEPLAHLFGQGIELSHRSTGGLGRNGDRGSGRSEDPHHEATRGVGPVTGSAGSESLPDRGGRHPASSPEGLLVLIPSRGPHLAPAPGLALPVPGVETESQPACRRGRGSRVADGFRGGVGRPETQPVRRPRIGAQAATGSPEAAWDPGHRRFRPEMIWIRTTAGLPEVERDPDSNEVSTPRGDSRRRPGDGDGGRRRS